LDAAAIRGNRLVELRIAVQGITRAFTVSAANPNQVINWIYILRLLAVLALVAAILRKNARRA